MQCSVIAVAVTYLHTCMDALADLGGPGGHAPQGHAKTSDCHFVICVSILGPFGVLVQFGPLQLCSLDPPEHGCTFVAAVEQCQPHERSHDI